MATSKKNLKATKKFEKKHLKGVLEKRKTTAKIKQRSQIKAKKQAKRAGDAEFHKGGGKDDGVVGDKPRANGKKPGATVGEMSVDDFFKGGFEILDGKDKGGKKSTGKLGKRKREPEATKKKGSAADEDSDSDGSIPNAPVESDSEDGSGASEDEDGVGMSKDAMDALAEKDPEFYRFLKENDPEALDFDENADMAEIDRLSSGAEEEEEEEQQAKKRKKDKKTKAKAAQDSDGQDKEQDSGDEFLKPNELTREMVARWKKSMAETQSLRAARQVVLAFRSAAHLNEADGDDAGQKKLRYSISSPEVFNDVLVVALKQIPEVLQHHVPVKESAGHRTYVPTEGKKFKTLSILMKTYTASVLHLLRTLSDDGTLKLTMSALHPLLPYLLSFRKLLKSLIKTVVAFWAQPSSSESTRITAFLVLRRLVVIGDKAVREAVLKAVYHGLVQGSRATNANTIQGINLMKNSAAELWGIDQGVGYAAAFGFIRQLAMHLRNSIVRNQNDSYRNVYNWQYVHSLDFWSRVLAEHCNPLREAERGGGSGSESQLRLLIYPLVQVTLGAMRLIPTAVYFPLRFQLVRSLLRLSRAAGVYVPLAPPLLEVLASAEMRRAPRPATLRPLDFAVAYKAAKSHLRTRVYQDGVGDQVVELLSDFFAVWSTSIAFPELALPVIVQLKRWVKEARKGARGGGSGDGGSSSRKAGKNGHKEPGKGKDRGGGGGGGGPANNKLVSSVVLLVQKLEANAKFIEEKRSKVDFAPRDRAQVEAFLKDFDWEKTPLGAFVVSQRKMREERARALEEARREEERKRKEEKEAEDHDGDEEEEGEDDDEDEDEDGEEEEDEDMEDE